MTDTQYQLNSNLPFDVSEHDPDVQEMLSAAPVAIWHQINSESSHDAIVKAYDQLGAWIAQNWLRFFPRRDSSLPSPVNGRRTEAITLH